MVKVQIHFFRMESQPPTQKSMLKTKTSNHRSYRSLISGCVFSPPIQWLLLKQRRLALQLQTANLSGDAEGQPVAFDEVDVLDVGRLRKSGGKPPVGQAAVKLSFHVAIGPDLEDGPEVNVVSKPWGKRKAGTVKSARWGKPVLLLVF